MPNVVADPDKLRQFAAQLTKASSELGSIARQLSRSLDQTGWNDSERARFEQDFRSTVRSLSLFSQRIQSEYVPGLKRKAAALDEYKR